MISIGEFKMAVNKELAAHSLTQKEWEKIQNNVKPISLANITANSVAGLYVMDKLNEVYRVIKRTDLTITSKKEVIMFLTKEG